MQMIEANLILLKGELGFLENELGLLAVKQKWPEREELRDSNYVDSFILKNGLQRQDDGILRSEDQTELLELLKRLIFKAVICIERLRF